LDNIIKGTVMGILIADSREPKNYQDKADVVYELEHGDYCIVVQDKRVLFERKTFADFYGSVLDGRLNEQLANVDVLIIEQGWIPHQVIDRRKLYDLINAVSIHTPVVQVNDMEHLFQTLRRYEQKVRTGEWGTIRIRAKMVLDKNLPAQVRMIASFVGIGVQKAKEVLKQYRSVKAALEHIADWHKAVAGVGKTLTKRAQEFYEQEVEMK